MALSDIYKNDSKIIKKTKSLLPKKFNYGDIGLAAIGTLAMGGALAVIIDILNAKSAKYSLDFISRKDMYIDIDGLFDIPYK